MPYSAPTPTPSTPPTRNGVRVIIRLNGGTRVLLAMAVLLLPWVSLAAGTGRKVTRVPDAVCFITTVTEQGHTRESRIIRSSGDRRADNAARRALGVTKRVDDIGVEREMHVLVNWYGVGFTIGFFELDEPLPEVCSTPPPERRRRR